MPNSWGAVCCQACVQMAEAHLCHGLHSSVPRVHRLVQRQTRVRLFALQVRQEHFFYLLRKTLKRLIIPIFPVDVVVLIVVEVVVGPEDEEAEEGAREGTMATQQSLIAWHLGRLNAQ